MTTYKNGRRMSLRAAINKAFRDRRESNKWSGVHKRRVARQQAKERAAGTFKDDPESEKIVAQLVASIEEYHRKLDALKVSDPEKAAKIVAQREKESRRLRRSIRESEKWACRIPADIDRRVASVHNADGTPWNSWYPASEKYSRFLTFPDNVRPDWLDGVIETCELVIGHPPTPRFTGPADSEATEAAQRECDRTVALARKALGRALALKRSRLAQK